MQSRESERKIPGSIPPYPDLFYPEVYSGLRLILRKTNFDQFWSNAWKGTGLLKSVLLTFGVWLWRHFFFILRFKDAMILSELVAGLSYAIRAILMMLNRKFLNQSTSSECGCFSVVQVWRPEEQWWPFVERLALCCWNISYSISELDNLFVCNLFTNMPRVSQ